MDAAPVSSTLGIIGIIIVLGIVFAAVLICVDLIEFVVAVPPFPVVASEEQLTVSVVAEAHLHEEVAVVVGEESRVGEELCYSVVVDAGEA